MTVQPIRVMIVDDEERVQQGLELFFEVCEDIRLVGAASNGQEAVRLACETEPDVILMDLMLAGHPRGLAAARAIHRSMPNIRIVALSAFFSSELIAQAMDTGITSYLSKTVSIDELADAIRAAFQGKPTISPDVAAILNEDNRPNPSATTP